MKKENFEKKCHETKSNITTNKKNKTSKTPEGRLDSAGRSKARRFVPAGFDDEIEISFMPRQWPVSKEGTKSLELGFDERSGSSDRPQEGGGGTLGEGVACDAPQEDWKLATVKVSILGVWQ